MGQQTKKPNYERLEQHTFEQYRENNKRIGSKAIKKCVKTDAQKIADGTHHWVRSANGKTTTLKKKTQNE